MFEIFGWVLAFIITFVIGYVIFLTSLDSEEPLLGVTIGLVFMLSVPINGCLSHYEAARTKNKIIENRAEKIGESAGKNTKEFVKGYFKGLTK